MRIHRWSLPLLLPALFVATLAAQTARRSGGADDGLPPYRADAEVTVSGTFTAAATAPLMSGAKWTLLTIDVNGQATHLLVGPEGWFAEQKMAPKAGAAVTATGMSNGLKWQGDPAMLVRTLVVSGRTLQVRDAAGVPRWQGQH
jgi:hypothetical protein